MRQSTRKISSVKKKKLHGVISKTVGNYENDPFVVKKTNEVRELIKEVGLPKKIKAGYRIMAKRQPE